MKLTMIKVVVLLLLLIEQGCASIQVARGGIPRQGNAPLFDCVKSNYKGDGEVFLAVSCGRSVMHAVGNLRPNAEYRIRFVGELIPQRLQSTAEGVVIFYNPYGKDVTMILKLKEDAR